MAEGKAGRPKMYDKLAQIPITNRMKDALRASAALEEVAEAEWVRRAIQERLQK